ncbi:MAG: class I SAM-dependent methyltransferase [Chitinispirillaceae bacterium]|nr:class I SAM-dependent methyltransferase [Chitinispirillaceae bacterium]
MQSNPNSDWDRKKVEYRADRLLIDGHQVMMDWETPYMNKMAEMLHEHAKGNILEVGFGMGISASRLQELGVESHTILEPHPEVFNYAQNWKKRYPDSKITLLPVYWQTVRSSLGQFDGIFFDTYSPTVEEANRKRFDFFATASMNLLKPGGALTFYYMKSHLEELYQDNLMRYFKRIYLESVPLRTPDDCEYAYIRDYALCVCAIL